MRDHGCQRDVVFVYRTQSFGKVAYETAANIHVQRKCALGHYLRTRTDDALELSELRLRSRGLPRNLFPRSFYYLQSG